MGLLELHDVVKRFSVRRGFFGDAKEFIHAVNGVSLSIAEGEILGLVGESGCGKSTLGRLALGLYRPDKGRVMFEGRDINKVSGEELKKIRNGLQVVFQDPFSSLNPRMSVRDIVTEPFLVHGSAVKKDLNKKAEELLISVNMDPSSIYRYPHEFSGGQRQRIGIARAIALAPKLIVLDEPVSSLDVAIQAEILELLKRLQKDFNMAYLFVTHDLRVVANICQRVAVMYLGRIMEVLPASNIRAAGHPYTRALLSAVPIADPGVKTNRVILEGDVPSPVSIPSGCPFHPRCRYKEDICVSIEPVLEEKRPGCFAACHFWDKK